MALHCTRDPLRVGERPSDSIYLPFQNQLLLLPQIHPVLWPRNNHNITQVLYVTTLKFSVYDECY